MTNPAKVCVCVYVFVCGVEVGVGGGGGGELGVQGTVMEGLCT